MTLEMTTGHSKERRLRTLRNAYVALLCVYGFLFLLPLLFIAFQNFLEQRDLESAFRVTEVPRYFYGVLALWLVPAFWMIIRITVRYYNEKAALR